NVGRRRLQTGVSELITKQEHFVLRGKEGKFTSIYAMLVELQDLRTCADNLLTGFNRDLTANQMSMKSEPVEGFNEARLHVFDILAGNRSGFAQWQLAEEKIAPLSKERRASTLSESLVTAPVLPNNLKLIPSADALTLDHQFSLLPGTGTSLQFAYS